MRPSSSMHAQLRPISPSPPRKVIRTESATRLQAAEHLGRSLLQALGCRAHRQTALARGQAHPEVVRAGGAIGEQHALGREELGESGAHDADGSARSVARALRSLGFRGGIPVTDDVLDVEDRLKDARDVPV